MPLSSGAHGGERCVPLRMRSSRENSGVDDSLVSHFKHGPTLVTLLRSATGRDRGSGRPRAPVGSRAVAAQRSGVRRASSPGVGRTGVSPVIRPTSGLSTARKTWLRGLASKSFGPLGLQIEPAYHGLAAHRRASLANLGITRVVDVGANVGQYAGALRRAGYAGDIVSFEANPAAARRLQLAAAGDRRWRIESMALGPEPGSTKLHVTVDSLSTSLLAPTADTQYAFMIEAPESVVVEVRTLDSFLLTKDKAPTLLKLDVQGYELEVLRGASKTLEEVAAVECELSLVPLYEGQALIEDVVGHLRAAGFRPVCFPRGFTDPTSHEVIQVDGLFLRDEG